ncbi:MAG: diacylglycerol/lipid kinase family protein [Vulcanimicrobiaceae bacterium]
MGSDVPAHDGKRSAVIIGNLHSRRTTELYARAHELLAARGVTIAAAHNVRDGREVRRRVERYVKDGCELIIIGGGDGTMTGAVGAFARTKSVLGVLPFGTGNSFALSLGIPSDVERAVDVIAGGCVARVDLGVVNGTYFANFATIGLSSTIARRTPNLLKKILGPASYAAAGVLPILSNRAFEAKIRWEGDEIRLRTHQLIVANGRYFGFTPVLPDATIVDGLLSVFTTSGLSRWDVARMFLAMYRGKHTTLADADYFSAKEVVIKTHPKQFVDVDGEAYGKTPVHFSIARRALRVLVPQGFTGT